jgi:glutamyl-Q tRNA(Asp) synthetase
MTRAYVGRFAPSPNGPLHFGSLVAALASWLDARAASGKWLLRIEDLDAPRVQPGAADAIRRQLEAFGLDWDGEVVLQSARGVLYRAALEKLERTGMIYWCGCSRAEIADSTLVFGDAPGVGLAPDGARIYPGTCRDGLAPGKRPRALRVRTTAAAITFNDRLLGEISQSVEREVGDFVLLRADGQVAYQLAVVVDDAEQGVTDVVRGADLLDSTARQIHLQRLLGAPTPRYLHVPVAVNAAGEKLSKQTRAPDATASDLPRALAFLELAPPAGIARAELLGWAVHAWDVARLPRLRALPA